MPIQISLKIVTETFEIKSLEDFHQGPADPEGSAKQSSAGFSDALTKRLYDSTSGTESACCALLKGHRRRRGNNVHLTIYIVKWHSINKRIKYARCVLWRCHRIYLFSACDVAMGHRMRSRSAEVSNPTLICNLLLYFCLRRSVFSEQTTTDTKVRLHFDGAVVKSKIQKCFNIK